MITFLTFFVVLAGITIIVIVMPVSEATPTLREESLYSIAVTSSAIRFKPYVVSQTAGYVGFVSAGAGAEIGNYWSTDLIAGFVPESVGGEDLWSLTWKNTANLYRFPTGSVISCSCKTKTRTIRERQDRLNRTFSEASRTKYQCFFVIL